MSIRLLNGTIFTGYSREWAGVSGVLPDILVRALIPYLIKSEVVKLESQIGVEKAMARYLNLYLALYQRTPRQLRDLGNNWILVNGARMNVEELENLANELHREYEQVLSNRRSAIKKLLNWLSKA